MPLLDREVSRRRGLCAARVRGMLRRIGATSFSPGGTIRETASFRGDDQPCLVEASLSCLACLCGDVEWSLGLEAWDAQVTCRCLGCGHARTVALTGEQALRLALDDHRA